ncbi:MAG: hypothetical protein ABI665_13525 [Vicinamibacterales bacterium]
MFLIAAIALALVLGDAELTPAWFAGKPSVIPGVKWFVVLAEVAALAGFLSQASTFGTALAMMLALANVFALALNGLSAMMFSNWGGYVNNAGLLLFCFYCAQVAILLLAFLTLREQPTRERDRYVPVAAILVVIWGVVLFLIAKGAA